MASKRYVTVDEAIDAVFQDDFGLSDSESSEDEGGNDIYAYLGEPVLQQSVVESLAHEVEPGSADECSEEDENDFVVDSRTAAGGTRK